jgi:ATP-dependent protease Clp ATPase subunit
VAKANAELYLLTKLINYRKSDNHQSTRDVSNEGVQQALLKLIGTDSCKRTTKGRTSSRGPNLRLNTKHLFICWWLVRLNRKVVSSGLNRHKLGLFDKNTDIDKENSLASFLKTSKILVDSRDVAVCRY